MIQACYECEEISESGDEPLSCSHKKYSYENTNKDMIGFLDSPDLEFGAPEGEKA